MVAIQKIPNRTIWVWAVLAAMAALSLSLLHPLFALGSGFLCAYVSYCAFDAVSRSIFGKEFQPPLKIPTPEWDTTRKWSDWVLLAPFIVVFVFLLFGFGEIADCLGGQDFWKSGWSLCSY
jgi:hypothetical protein